MILLNILMIYILHLCFCNLHHPHPCHILRWFPGQPSSQIESKTKAVACCRCQCWGAIWQIFTCAIQSSRLAMVVTCALCICIISSVLLIILLDLSFIWQGFFSKSSFIFWQEKSIEGNTPLHCAALFGSSGHSHLSLWLEIHQVQNP